jgi:hypothetical protein
MQDFAPGWTGPVSEEASQADGKPQLRLTYEQIAHLHTKDFERAVCKMEFVRKYSKYDNILQFLHVFRGRIGIGPYDPMPEDKLDEYIRELTPFDNWKEFLVAAFEWQAAPDEIAQAETRALASVSGHS